MIPTRQILFGISLVLLAGCQTTGTQGPNSQTSQAGRCSDFQKLVRAPKDIKLLQRLAFHQRFAFLKSSKISAYDQALELANSLRSAEGSDSFLVGSGSSTFPIKHTSAQDRLIIKNLQITTALLRARANIANQIRETLSGEVKSALNRHRKSTSVITGSAIQQALIGAHPVAFFETQDKADREIATVIVWSQNMRSETVNILAGCGHQISKSGRFSSLSSQVSELTKSTIPMGYKMTLDHNGLLSLIGFGAFPLGRSASEMTRAKKFARKFARRNLLFGLVSNVVKRDLTESRMTQNSDTNLISSATSLNSEISQKLEVVNLRGLRKIYETILFDPIVRTRVYFVAMSITPGESSKTANSVGRFIKSTVSRHTYNLIRGTKFISNDP